MKQKQIYVAISLGAGIAGVGIAVGTWVWALTMMFAATPNLDAIFNAWFYGGIALAVVGFMSAFVISVRTRKGDLNGH